MTEISEETESMLSLAATMVAANISDSLNGLYQIVSFDDLDPSTKEELAFYRAEVPTKWVEFFTDLFKVNRYIETSRIKIAQLVYSSLSDYSFDLERSQQSINNSVDQRTGAGAINYRLAKKDEDIEGSKEGAENFLALIQEFSPKMLINRVETGFEIKFGQAFKQNLSDFMYNNTMADLSNSRSNKSRMKDTGCSHKYELCEDVLNNENKLSADSYYSGTIKENVAKVTSTCVDAVKEVEKLFGIDLSVRTNLTKKIWKKVPADYDFSTLFGHNVLSTGEDSVLKTVVGHFSYTELLVGFIPHKRHVEEYESYLSIVEEAKERPPYKGSRKETTLLTWESPINTAVALSTCSIVVLPVFTVSNSAAIYLTQSHVPNTSAFYQWASAWTRSMFGHRADKIRPGISTTRRMKINDYVIPMSRLNESSEKRVAQGLHSCDGRGDEQGIIVNERGRLYWTPKASNVSNSAAKEYEKQLEDIIALSANINEPFDLTRETSDDVNKETDEKLKEVKHKIRAVSCYPLLVDWNLNAVAHVGENSEIIAAATEGQSAPRKLAIPSAMYQEPHAAIDLLVEGGKNHALTYYSPTYDTQSSVYDSITNLWAFQRLHNHVPDIEVLFKEAITSLHSEKMLEKESISDEDYDAAILKDSLPYNSLVLLHDGTGFITWDRFVKSGTEDIFTTRTDNFTLSDAQKQVVQELGINRYWNESNKQLLFYTACARFLVKLFIGIPETFSSKLFRDWVKTSKFSSYSHDDYTDIPFYFSHLSGNPVLADMSKLNNLVIGRAAFSLFREIGKEANSLHSVVASFDTNHPVPMVKGKSFLPSFDEMRKVVMPMVSILGHYVPNVEKYRLQMLEEQHKIVPDHDLPVPHVPGAVHAMLLPHQTNAFKTLEKAPEIAVLGIDAGGGKTITGLIDAISLMAKGLIKKPLVLCPGGLIKDWINELNKLTKGRYNTIPIDTKTFNRMVSEQKGIGEDKFISMMINAPVNTFFFSSFSFLRNEQAVTVGPISRYVYARVEMFKKIGFDCIVIDESHKLKGRTSAGAGDSQQSRAALALTQDPAIKHIRLLSGTVVSNRLNDVVGQMRLVDPSIFRTKEEFEATFMSNNSYRQGAGRMVADRIRSRTALLTGKRKEWAWMLPTPVYTNHFVEMDPDLQKIYDAILDKAITSLENDPSIQKLMSELKGDKEVSETEDDDEETGDENVNRIESIIDTVIISRLEQFIHDPAHDEEAKQIISKESILANKVRPPKQDMLEKIIRNHFRDPETKDSKILVFCRHISTAEAVYNYLPEDLKAISTYYHGSARLKPNLNAWAQASNKKTMVMIAVETSVNTGYNFQFASRIVRLDAPWTPGELEQAMARVFRPDVQNVHGRKKVYIDTIICDNSFDIAKNGKLVSKIFENLSFNEADNPKYAVFRENSPPMLKMNLNTLRNIRYRSDIEQEYLAPYNDYQVVYKDDIESERTRVMSLGADKFIVKIKDADMMKGAMKMDFTPLADGQKMHDTHGYDLMPFNEWIKLPENHEIEKNLKGEVARQAIVGLRVMTEMGPATVSNYRVDMMGRIGSISVKLAGETKAIGYPSTIIYVCQTVSKHNEHRFTNKVEDHEINGLPVQKTVKPKIVEEEEKPEPVSTPVHKPRKPIHHTPKPEDTGLEDVEELEALPGKEVLLGHYEFIKNVNITLNDIKELLTKGTKFSIWEKDGKFILKTGKIVAEVPENRKNAAIDPVRAIRIETPEEEKAEDLDLDSAPKAEERGKAEVFLTVVDGMPCLQLNDVHGTDVHTIHLGNSVALGQYIYNQFYSLQQYNNMLEYLYKNYHIDADNKKELEEFRQQFSSYRNKLVGSLNTSRLQKFIHASPSSDHKYLRIHPLVEHDHVHLIISYSLPAAHALVNKRIPGAGPSKWVLKDKTLFAFVKNKSDAANEIANIERTGIEITNRNDLEFQLNHLTVAVGELK